MDLILGNSVILGLCLNLSESGLLGTFSNPVPVNSEGLLTLYYNQRSYQVHAQIEGYQGDQTRVGFHYASDAEQDSIRSLLKLLIPESHV